MLHQILLLNSKHFCTNSHKLRQKQMFFQYLGGFSTSTWQTETYAFAFVLLNGFMDFQI
jgi:hypothetical protein